LSTSLSLDQIRSDVRDTPDNNNIKQHQKHRVNNKRNRAENQRKDKDMELIVRQGKHSFLIE